MRAEAIIAEIGDILRLFPCESDVLDEGCDRYALLDRINEVKDALEELQDTVA